MTTRKASSRRATSNSHQRIRQKGNMLAFTGVEDPAMITMFTLLMAKQATVTANSVTYNGLFSGVERLSNKQELCIELRFVQLSRAPSSPVVVHDLRGLMAKRVLIPVNCISTLTASMPNSNNRSDGSKGFVTDGEIARGPVRAGRELKRFDDFGHVQPHVSTPGSGNIDEQTFGELASNGNRNRNWDQFQVNRDKFGVNTSFDETEYTTKIDRSGANFEQREREAQRMAAEIERTDSTNIHIREERNQQLGTDFDEEARFSGVQRQSSTNMQKGTAQPRRSYLAAASGATDPGQNAKSSSGANKGGPNGKHTPNASGKGGAKSQSASTKSPAGNPKQHAAVHTKQHSGVKTSQAPKSHSGQGKYQVPETKSGATTAWAAASATVPATTKTKPHVSASKSSAQHSKSSKAVMAAGQGKEGAPSTRSTASAKGSALSASGSAEKERPAFDKQLKPPATRERSGSIPQFIKIRNSITGRNSPNQSRNSPLPIATSADTSAIGVLNLDAQTPNLGPEQIKRFEEYKTNRELQSIADNREEITDNLKKFSTQLDSRNNASRRTQSTSSQSISRVSSNVSTSSISNSSNTTEKSTVTNVTTTSAVTSDKNNNNLASTEKKKTHGKEPVPDKKKAERTEDNTKKTADPEKASEVPKPKPKFKLNPNAQEFKFNPDAPAFEPSAPSTPKAISHQSPAQQQQQQPGVFNMYAQGATPAEFSQQMPQPQQGYAVNMQSMTPVPYGGQPYVMMSPGVHAAVPGSVAMGYPYVQGNQIGFPPGPVPGRYQPNPGAPVSYSGVYPPVAPIMMTPATQRVPSSAFYYNPGPYSGGQGTNPNLPPHPAQHMFQQHQMGPGHMQGGMSGGQRGGPHGNHRRSGPGKGRGKQYSHSHTHPNSNTTDRQTPTSPQGGAITETGAR